MTYAEQSEREQLERFIAETYGNVWPPTKASHTRARKIMQALVDHGYTVSNAGKTIIQPGDQFL